MLPVVDQMRGHWLLGIAGLLTLIGLTGLWVYDAGRTSIQGVIGYAVTVLGGVVFSIGNIAEAGFGIEFGTVLFGAGLLILIAGVVILGTALVRLKVLRAWSVWPLMLGLVAFLPVVGLGGATFGPDAGTTASPALWLVLAWLGAILLGAGWLTLGYALWTGVGRQVRPAQPLS